MVSTELVRSVLAITVAMRVGAMTKTSSHTIRASLISLRLLFTHNCGFPPVNQLAL